MNQQEKYCKKIRRKQRKLWYNNEIAKLDDEIAPVKKELDVLLTKRRNLNNLMWGYNG